MVNGKYHMALKLTQIIHSWFAVTVIENVRGFYEGLLMKYNFNY